MSILGSLINKAVFLPFSKVSDILQYTMLEGSFDYFTLNIYVLTHKFHASLLSLYKFWVSHHVWQPTYKKS